MAGMLHVREKFTSLLIILSSGFLLTKTILFIIKAKFGKSLLENTTSLGLFVVIAFFAIFLFSVIYYASLRFKVICEDYISNAKYRNLAITFCNIFCLLNFAIFFVAILNFISKI
jgi:succinate dehydrogenase hydrophobic anchor subunit